VGELRIIGRSYDDFARLRIDGTIVPGICTVDDICTCPNNTNTENCAIGYGILGIVVFFLSAVIFCCALEKIPCVHKVMRSYCYNRIPWGCSDLPTSTQLSDTQLESGSGEQRSTYRVYSSTYICVASVTACTEYAPSPPCIVQIPLNFKITVCHILLYLCNQVQKSCQKEWKKLSRGEDMDQHVRFKEPQATWTPANHLCLQPCQMILSYPGTRSQLMEKG
jgi:hypothetical protein